VGSEGLLRAVVVRVRDACAGLNSMGHRNGNLGVAISLVLEGEKFAHRESELWISTARLTSACQGYANRNRTSSPKLNQILQHFERVMSHRRQSFVVLTCF
jgi:hypothetical protein